MVWSRFGLGFDPWTEMSRLHREFDRLFNGYGRRPASDFPPVNVWKSSDSVVVTAELPGMSPSDLDITVMKNTVTLRGTRKSSEASEGTSFHRRERGSGDFVRSLQLPYDVDSDKVHARYEDGVLRLELPRAEAQKPKRITVK